MRKTVEVKMATILALVGCAEDYGHANDVVLDGFADMLDYDLSNDEIEGYVSEAFLSPDAAKAGYGKEDADEVRNRVVAFRKRYID